MLKSLFWPLLALNLLLFAIHHGLFGSSTDGHEPGRLANQLNVNRIKLLIPANDANLAPAASVPAASAAVQAVPVATAAASVEKPQDALACIEIGNFTVREAKQFDSQLAALSLGDKLSRHNAREVTGYMVYVPPYNSKEEADRKAAELGKLGVSDFFVMQNDTDMRWAISLGIFKTENAAQTRLASLDALGMHNARILPRNAASGKILFRIKSLDLSVKGSVDKIKADFPKQEIRSCDAG